MTGADVKIQQERIEKYNTLTERARAIHRALEAMEEPGPFTGNMRETRRVEAMQLRFSATRGGAPGITIDLRDLNVDANELGRWLDQKLRAEYESVQQQIAKL